MSHPSSQESPADSSQPEPQNVAPQESAVDDTGTQGAATTSETPAIDTPAVSDVPAEQRSSVEESSAEAGGTEAIGPVPETVSSVAEASAPSPEATEVASVPPAAAPAPDAVAPVSEETLVLEAPIPAHEAASAPELSTPAEAVLAPEAVTPADVAAGGDPVVDVDMNALLEQQPGADGGVQQAKVGDKVSGVVVRLGDENCFIDFGGRSEGLIRTTELKGDDGEMAFSVGEPLEEAFVISLGSDGGAVVLSRFVSGEARLADTLYKAYKAGIPVEGLVMAVNKWGLGIDLEGLRSFCPVSQVDTEFTENLEQYRDKTMAFKIIRFRDRGRSIVLSRRALLEVEQEKDAGEVREMIVKGAQLTGTVTRLESFGAFVDLGSRVEGLIHVSELRHERVSHPQDVVQLGQEVTVKVIAVKDLGERRKERISLTIKAMEKDPWDEIRTQFTAGSVTMGRIEGLEDYGAFVELAPNVRGLIHVSELADRRVNHPRDVVSVGDEVKVAVLEVDNKRKRLRLSIRRAEQVEGDTNLKEFTERQQQEQAAEGATNTSMFDALKRAKLVE